MKQTITKVKEMSPKKKRIILFSILIVAILIMGSKFLSGRQPSKSNSSDVQIAKPQKTEIINKEFTFPVTNAINIKFEVSEASLNKQIVVSGQNATAIDGRTFLIVTIKISNNFNQSIKINTRDYVRLSVNGDENTWLAPDIHNDPVEVQAISTKFTRVGFPVNITDKNFVLQIGEIKGNKQKIELKI